jgi:hypothetical protein
LQKRKQSGQETNIQSCQAAVSQNPGQSIASKYQPNEAPLIRSLPQNAERPAVIRNMGNLFYLPFQNNLT